MSSLFSSLLLESCTSDDIETALEKLQTDRPNSSVLARKLANKISGGFGDWCETAADAIVSNLLVWLNIKKSSLSLTIDVSHIKMIEKLVKKADERSMLALCLLIPLSKSDLVVFGDSVEYFDNPNSFCIVDDEAEIPNEETLKKALEYLKSGLIATKIAEIASKCTTTTVSYNDVVNVINEIQIRFVRFEDDRIRAWATANGVVVNIEAVKKQSSYTLLHPVALCSVLGHALQHYLNIRMTDDLNFSTPELVSCQRTSQSPSPCLTQLTIEPGLFFELAVIGEKFDYKKGGTKKNKSLGELLELLSTRISTAAKLPLLEKQEIDRFGIFIAEYNREFAFDLSASRVFE